LFIKRIHGNILIVSLYVDNTFFIGNRHQICEDFKSLIQLEFDMTE